MDVGVGVCVCTCVKGWKRVEASVLIKNQC